MSRIFDSVLSAVHADGWIVIRTVAGQEMRFPIAENPRLRTGSKEQLDHIEISPLGLHWPDLDEDLSFAGLAEGNYGQFQKDAKV